MAARCYPFSGDTSLTRAETVALTLASIVGQLDESKPGGFRRFQMLAQRVIDRIYVAVHYASWSLVKKTWSFLGTPNELSLD